MKNIYKYLKYILIHSIMTTMYCNNCGKKSHIYKECLLPKISLGIKLYTYIDKVLHYLLVRRKDTIGYIEFLRGKYIKNDIEYIQTLFNQMTNQEHKMLIKFPCFHSFVVFFCSV